MKAWQLRIVGVSVIDANVSIYSEKIYLHFPTVNEIDEFINWSSNSENVPLFSAVNVSLPYKVMAFEREIIGDKKCPKQN